MVEESEPFFVILQTAIIDVKMDNKPCVTLIDSQKRVLKRMTDFVFDSNDRIFILKGYAGTGKTTLMRFLIEEMQKRKQGFTLLSTTGRAAKILSNHTDCHASTIHSMIYKFSDFNKDVSDLDPKSASIETTGQLFLVFEPSVLSNDDRDAMVYIIDEASMVSDFEQKDVVQAQFGNGKVLTELLAYDTLDKSKFIFVGDPCQLPPVLGSMSPALSTDYFENCFGLHAQQGVLTEIMRQDNSIIAAGAYIRKLWANAPEFESAYPRGNYWGAPLRMSQYKDFEIHADLAEMEDLYLDCIRQHGYNHSIFICNSNAKCSEMSGCIRNALGFNGSVKQGDLLMVVQNQMTTGLMNGDMVEVVEIRSETERAFRDVMTPDGYHTTLMFREIKVKELFTQKIYSTMLLENPLEMKQVNLDSRQQSGLFLDFILRMKRKGIDQRRTPKDFEKAMREDPYLNALRCNYGYAVTCHKAQGGEWESVFIQMPRNITLKPTKNKYQWFYTAITRAKHTVHLCKDFFIA